MKTFKQFNEEAQYHIHEVDRLGFGIPGGGFLMRGGASVIKQLAKPYVYRGIGAFETGRQLYRDIKNKKPIGNGLITSFNKKQALQRLNNGKEAAQAVLDVLKIF